MFSSHNGIDITALNWWRVNNRYRNIPVDEGALGVHQIKLMIKTRPGLGNSGRVGKHADRSGYFGKVTTRNNRRGLIVDANLNFVIEDGMYKDGMIVRVSINDHVRLHRNIYRLCNIFLEYII